MSFADTKSVNCDKLKITEGRNLWKTLLSACPVYLLYKQHKMKCLVFNLLSYPATDYATNFSSPCRSQWARGQRLGFRIPGMSVCFEWCVLSGRGLCLGLITCPEESYRVWGVQLMWSRSLGNEEALAAFWLLRLGRGGGGYASSAINLFCLNSRLHLIPYFIEYPA